MADSTHQALAAALWNARQAGTVVTTEQHPTDVASAYALLAAVTDASGREIVGYKLGATAEATLNLLQLTAPLSLCIALKILPSRLNSCSA